MSEAQPDRDRWKYRRLAVFLTMAYVGIAVGYLIVCGQDTALHRETASMLIMLGGAVVVSYIGGAVADDFLQKRNPS